MHANEIETTLIKESVKATSGFIFTGRKIRNSRSTIGCCCCFGLYYESTI